MKVEVLILVENTTPVPDFCAEYGFSALISVDNKTFLFDTGSNDALLKNSHLAGVDLAQVKDLIISHGHFDHTGGVIPFVQLGKERRIYAHSNIFTPRYSLTGDKLRDIGVKFDKLELLANDIELITTDGYTEIWPSVFVTGEIPRITDYEDVGGNFLVKCDGKLIADNIPDDMSMVINHPDGLIIISGCAHAGIINTIEYARKKSGRSEVLAFIGGTHLMKASEERLAKTVSALRNYNMEKIIVSHCTGFNATVRLFNEFGSKLVKGETSMCFQF